MYFADQLIPLSADDGQGVVCELAPLFFDRAGHLIPLSFCLFPVPSAITQNRPMSIT